ncbi:PREDICTED: uncharacterized protein LOC109472040 [Branchiostoma belcheri]|uniref:Uncharacterized protein LOC109472040 n=1 Tax=Branchiostoma belcheri TaxID=7741 RepID=A0A6P4YZQ5_BRABE|nr:PREDICTED: uncharacterized protein LOC109472040 [Branchiostoma belcheri]
MEVMEVTSDDIAGPKLIRNTTPSVVAGSVGQGPAREATASPTVDEPANATASTKHAGRANDSRASINPSTSNHTAEDDKPSKPRGISKELLGVTSDGQIGTTPPATETIPVKTTAAQSASNGCKTTTIGVTVQHRPVPELCGDTHNTAEPVQVTVATKSMVGDIPEDKTVYPPQQDARHCHNGVVNIPDQRVNQKGSAASPENQSLCSNTLPARVIEADKPSEPRGVSKELLGVTSDGRIGTMPSAAETIPVKTPAAQSASNGCKTTTIRRFVCPVPEPYSYGDTGNTAELSQATVATKSTVGLTAEDMTGHPPRQDARHCQHGVVEIAERKPSASVLLSLLTSTKAGNVQRPPTASRPEETPDVPNMCRGRETPEAVDSSVALDLTVRKEPAPVVTGSRYTYERQEGSTGPYRYQTASDPVRKMCSNAATSRQAGATGEKTTPPKPSQQQIKSEPGVSTCAYVESANSSMRHSRLPDFAENAQQGGSRPQHPYPSQAQITSQTSIMSTERTATVGEPRSSVSPLDELQTFSGNVDKLASSSPPNSAAFGPPRYVPTGVAQKRYASPPLHHLNEVQTFSGNVSPSPSNAAASGPPHYNPTGAVPPLHSRHDVQTFSGAPNVGIPAGFVTRKRKGSPVEEMANVPSKRKSPCELMGNYAVQQQQGQGEKFCQEGLSSHSVCSPSTITGHVRQAVGPTQGVISDAIYKKNDMRRLQLTWESCGPVDGVPRDKAQEKFPVVIVFEQMKVALTSDFVSLFPHVTLTDFMKALGGIGLKICPCPVSVKEWFMQVGKEDAACSTVVKSRV